MYPKICSGLFADKGVDANYPWDGRGSEREREGWALGLATCCIVLLKLSLSFSISFRLEKVGVRMLNASETHNTKWAGWRSGRICAWR